MSHAAPSPDEPSPLAFFLRALFETGEVLVPPFPASAETTADEPILPPDADALLRDWIGRDADELAFSAPRPDPHALAWVSRHFFHACQLLADREPGEAAVRRALAPRCPSPPGPETDYAVDLIFRFLPDLLDLAVQRAPGDALVEILRAWTREWPLSSVGVPLSEISPGNDTLAHPTMRRLYLDRIFARGAKDRLASPGLRRWIEADAGSHPEFAGKLAALAGPSDQASSTTPAFPFPKS